MKIRRGFIFWFSYLIAIAVIAWGVTVYGQLPAQIAMHWDINGQPDNFAPKWQLVWIGLLVIAIPLLMDLIPYIDPRRKNYNYFSQSYQMIKLGITGFMAFVAILSIQTNLGGNMLSTSLMGLSLGLLFMLIGNYLAKVRSNFFVGIRTPWTLSSDEVWRKTHRMGGWMFFLVGLATVIGGLVLSGKYLFVIVITGAVLVSVGTMVYSYLLYRKLQ